MATQKKSNFILSLNMLFHKIFFGIVAGMMILSTQPGFTAQISFKTAEKIAVNFITYLGENHTIHDITPEQQSDQTVGYLVNLTPQGYILVAGDTIRVPVKAYSLTSNFANLPPVYVQNLLNELEIKIQKNLVTQSNSIGSSSPEETNRSYWDFLTMASMDSRTSINAYTPNTYLLTTQWNQTYPYNKLNPEVGDELTLTGCTQTALAQVMRYNAHPASGSGVFNHTWNGQTLTAVMNRPFNWSAMPDRVTGNSEQYQQEEVAALMRDLGILNKAHFGTDATSTSFNYNDFERAFGYAPVSEMSIYNNDFFTTIANEINNQRPLLLSMPNHMVVADGYASDETGIKIHINMGWGGSDDDYYFLDQTIVTEHYSFPPNHTIYYNIKPCQGAECNPYTPDSYGYLPVIASELDDMVIDNTKTLRIEVYDPDGDTVTLSASSSCDNLQVSLNGNLLTLTPGAYDIFCEVTVTAQSHDGTAEKTFKVLVLEDMVNMGTQYDLGGQFIDQNEIDEYTTYLQGYTTVSGTRGYSNQAFYIWVKDSSGTIVIPASDTEVATSLTGGLYTINASLKNSSSYYNYDADFSEYILTVTCGQLTYTVPDLADSLGIELSQNTYTAGNVILTSALPNITITTGSDSKVYGTGGANHIIIQSKAKAELFNVPGNNTITIEADSSLFTVSRSGATVTFEGTDGTFLKMPATATHQGIVFNNHTYSLIIDSNRVMLGTQEVYLTPEIIL